MRCIDAIHSAASRLAAAGILDARLDAELLLRHVLKRDRAWLFTHASDLLAETEFRAYDTLIDRRIKREPLQYIVGSQEFWGLDFIVAPGVLIPRPETELVVETALNVVPDKKAEVLLVDLCTGSGCIAVSLAKELPAARIFATDRSSQALAIAKKNAVRHGVEERIRFFEGDLFGPLEELEVGHRIDVIVSNPPYIPGRDLPSLQPEVRDFEPEIALIAGPDGTEIHERIVRQAPHYLKEDGTLVMEMGIGQAAAISGMIRASGAFDKLSLLKDLAGIERVIVSQRK